MKILTEEEQQQIIEAAMDARLAGDKDTASRLFRQIPVDPQLARSIKDTGGPAVLQGMANKGYNMSEVEATYGSGWLQG
jgi:hypothetical protein